MALVVGGGGARTGNLLRCRSTFQHSACFACSRGGCSSATHFGCLRLAGLADLGHNNKATHRQCRGGVQRGPRTALEPRPASPKGERVWAARVLDRVGYPSLDAAAAVHHHDEDDPLEVLATLLSGPLCALLAVLGGRRAAWSCNVLHRGARCTCIVAYIASCAHRERTLI